MAVNKRLGDAWGLYEVEKYNEIGIKKISMIIMIKKERKKEREREREKERERERERERELFMILYLL